MKRQEPIYTEWRTAYVEYRAEGFGPNQWVRELGMATIRPGEFTVEQRLDASGSVRILPYLQAARMILRSYTP